MPTPAQVQPYVLGAVAVLVTWRLYSRVRRLVGRQKFAPVRAWFSVCFFPLLVLALLAGTWSHPLRSLSELAGVAVGIGLGHYGLRLTRFEDAGDGHFYTPSAHIGIGLSLLFIGRLGYKLIHAYMATAGFTEPPAEIVKSPLTLLIIGTLAGYYATYAFGLLRWRHTGIAPSTAATTPPSRT
jgi:hypothetical protein